MYTLKTNVTLSLHLFSPMVKLMVAANQEKPTVFRAKNE